VSEQLPSHEPAVDEVAFFSDESPVQDESDYESWDNGYSDDDDYNYSYEDDEDEDEEESGEEFLEDPSAKYPQISVKLIGEDGNVYAILGRVRRAMVSARVPQNEIDAFFAEATSGDYYAALATCQRWVSVY
jgi:hypothetical protein